MEDDLYGDLGGDIYGQEQHGEVEERREEDSYMGGEEQVCVPDLLETMMDTHDGAGNLIVAFQSCMISHQRRRPCMRPCMVDHWTQAGGE